MLAALRRDMARNKVLDEVHKDPKAPEPPPKKRK